MKRSIALDTKRKLDAMFLPEIHQARWAERRALLHERLQTAEMLPADKRAETIAVVQAEIKEHYKHRFDVEQARCELDASCTAAGTIANGYPQS